jgi:XTP/dITP diphosphohydrolase
VFAGGDASDLERSWDAIKAAEKGGRTSVTDGVPLSQPALSLALKLQRRAGRLGAPTDLPGRAGDLLARELWDVVRRCREQRIDPEAALRAVARGFRDRLARVEADLRNEGREPADLTPDEWAARWR